jgi:hypothetical protein
VKYVEFQCRGSVHLHALVRIDVRPDEFGTPASGIDAGNGRGARHPWLLNDPDGDENCADHDSNETSQHVICLSAAGELTSGP